ncbi:phosphodiester glycosidase family protein [Roseibacillus persicicus]|uniref:phosphodiester glycosidase family protein n=1 Tax=Roseibacillus persicicus TaxID=454148 RepID=UPI00398A7399
MIRLVPSLLFLSVLPLFPQYQRAELQVSADGRAGAMHFYRFDAKSVALKVIPRGTHRNLGAAMSANKCIAGCNGGFFDPRYQPLGEVIASGQKSGKRNLASSLTSGVLYQKGGVLAIERSKSFYQKNIAAPELIQTGPFLIESGKVVSGLSNRKFARRTLIATDGKGQWFIAYTPPTTLAQLAQSLHAAGHQYGFKIQTALNFDGGSSSALWVGKGEGKNPFYLHEIKPVANYIGLVAK